MQPVGGVRWFTRRQVGFGFRPVTWQGWLITAVAVALVVVLLILLRSSRVVGIAAAVVVLAVYLGTAALLGGVPRAGPAPAPDPPARRSTSPPAPPATSPPLPPATSRPTPFTPSVATAPAQVAPPALPSAGLPSPDGAALVVDHLTKRFGERTAFEDVSFRSAGRGLRLPRPERRGQDDDGADARHADRADLGLGHWSPASRCAPRTAPRSARASRSCPSPPASTCGSRCSRTSSASPASTSCADAGARIDRRCEAVNLADRGRRPLRHPLQGPAPAGRPGPCAAQRPGGPVPRRADLRSRPGRHARGPRPDRRAAPARGDRSS